jgi:sialate O-acetylesterase
MTSLITLVTRPFSLASVLVIALSGTVALADVSVPKLFSDHMVLQRDKPIKIWGWADSGEAVKVSLAGESATAVADADGTWMITLPALPAGGPHSVSIEGNNKLVLQDVLIGEVWIASGQSNMQWAMNNSLNVDLAKLMVNRQPQIRFNQVWNRGSQTPQDDVTDPWAIATPESIGRFSAVAYAFAETLHATLGVPVGIIQNAWGGSNAETWVDRQIIINDPELVNIHEDWLNIEATFDLQAEMAKYEKQLAAWKVKAEQAKAADQDPPRQPRKPHDRMTAQHRPGNLWNGRVLPIAPITIRGAIWYQGEGNSHSVERAMQYEHLFSTMITEWRKLWGEDFSFYWVQLADFKTESAFGENETWAYLRNSQTGTMALPNTGQAVIVDIGEGYDIHPRQKEEVGRRLARWALNKDYGYSDLVCRSPELDSWKQNGNKLVLKFNYTGKGLRPFDTRSVHGFTVKDEAGNWNTVEGRTRGKDQVIIELAEGVNVTAVAYAWADNPVCNLFTYEGLPVTPFKTDVE